MSPFLPKPDSSAHPLLLWKSTGTSRGSQSHQVPSEMFCKLRVCPQPPSSLLIVCHIIIKKPNGRLRIHLHPSFEQCLKSIKVLCLRVSSVGVPPSLRTVHPALVSPTCQAAAPGTTGVEKSKTETLFHGACCMSPHARISGNEVRVLSVPLETPGPGVWAVSRSGQCAICFPLTGTGFRTCSFPVVGT